MEGGLHAVAGVWRRTSAGLASIVVIAVFAGCAHRGRTPTAALVSPPPPRHSIASDDERSASQATEQNRRSRDDPKGAAGNADITQPTDASGTPSHPTGTSWSVVVRSAPGAHAANPGVAPENSDAEPEAASPKSSHPWKRWVDIVGGSIGALCCVLALRKRARLSSTRSNDW